MFAFPHQFWRASIDREEHTPPLQAVTTDSSFACTGLTKKLKGLNMPKYPEIVMTGEERLAKVLSVTRFPEKAMLVKEVP